MLTKNNNEKQKWESIWGSDSEIIIDVFLRSLDENKLERNKRDYFLNLLNALDSIQENENSDRLKPVVSGYG